VASGGGYNLSSSPGTSLVPMLLMGATDDEPIAARTDGLRSQVVGPWGGSIHLSRGGSIPVSAIVEGRSSSSGSGHGDRIGAQPAPSRPRASFAGA